MNGNNVYVSVGGTIIAGTKVNEIQIDCETIEISGPNVAEWREYIVKRKEWSISTSFLVTASSQITAMLQVGTTVTISVVNRESGTPAVLLQGQAIVKQAKESFSRGKLAQGSWKFTGNGALSVPSSGGGTLE